jgi:polygalacturonase
MSGGARNIYVSDCTFVGTDIGLRFKTTRGRGGIVENIFIKNINMKNIVGEAILFDMYYAAQDPIALAGEKRAAPKTEMLPVSETTPQFRNIYIDNVVCNGADKAVFIRGLPEMSIKNISLSNLTIKANQGIDMQEGENITFKNVTIDAAKADPLIFIQNSRNVAFDRMKFSDNIPLLFSIYGDRTSGIVIQNTNVKGAISLSQFDFGADKKALIIK